MELLLGFHETQSNLDENYKLVPWLNWDEWDFVRLSLFSSSPDSIAKALRRIIAWRSRGYLPVTVEVTASIIEIQQKDPHFRDDLCDGVLDSEEMLAMLYSMAITRLVNGVIEKTRNKKEVSIAEAAAAIDMPRMLVDARHEGSHRDLPSLRLLRLASIKALSWLESYYWDPQKKAIPCKKNKSANIRKEVRSRLRELAFSLKVRQSCGSSEVEGKRAKHHEAVIGATLHGRNKFFSLMASKVQHSKCVGSRKQLQKTLKSIVRLYTSFSSDVVSVMLEFLLKAPNSSNMVDSPDKFEINLNIDAVQSVYEEWKPVITKLSKKTPELLVSLLKGVLDMIDSHKSIRDDFGSEHFSLSQYDSETQRIRVLSTLFKSLVLILKGLKPLHNDQGSQIKATCLLPEPKLIELMRKCLHVSDPENQELIGSAVLLAKMTGNSYLNDRLHKLSLLTLSYPSLAEHNSSDVNVEDLTHQDKHLHQAAEKLQLIKHYKAGKAYDSINRDDNIEDSNLWTVVKSWNPCPIGMLPHVVGSSGCLPVLDFGVDDEHKAALDAVDEEDHTKLRQPGKREPTCDTETIDGSNIKRMRGTLSSDFPETEDTNLNITTSDGSEEPEDTYLITQTSDGSKGRLLIGGVWQQVGDQELQDIKSRVRILATRSEIEA